MRNCKKASPQCLGRRKERRKQKSVKRDSSNEKEGNVKRNEEDKQMNDWLKTQVYKYTRKQTEH